MAEARVQRRLAAILGADVAGYSWAPPYADTAIQLTGALERVFPKKKPRRVRAGRHGALCREAGAHPRWVTTTTADDSSAYWTLPLRG